MDPTALRHQLKAAGFVPLPLRGKAPFQGDWQKRVEPSAADIDGWALHFPDALNTGALCRLMPTLDIDITNNAAAEAIENLVRERFAERGEVLTRIGRPPKRAILFRTAAPFKKIVGGAVAPDGGAEQKIEFLADGQQVVVAGIHPETNQPYVWHGGAPGSIKYDQLPHISEAEASALVADAVELLCGKFGYSRAAERPRNANGGDAGAADWGYLIDNIRSGRDLHDSLRDLAAKLVASGMGVGAAINLLRGWMDKSEIPHDARWKQRYAAIPRLVESAAEATKAEASTAASAIEPWPIERVLETFEHWLILPSRAPVYAVLGAVAANRLPGIPVWLGLVAPPSSAKTEILNSISTLPNVYPAATVTPAALLSGVPKKQHHKGAMGGLLRQIGDFGIISLKDFGSVLSMRPDAKAEILAALREIYDGAWTRHLGTDGGRTLSWRGKVGLIFGCTGVIDGHYSVISSMGDRFLLNRLAPCDGQFRRALKHSGAAAGQMQKELAEAVAHLFAGVHAQPRPFSEESDEFQRLDRVVALAVRLRGTVDRDRYSREVEAIYGKEGTARIGLTLERLLAGLDTLGLDRKAALDVVEGIAMDSVPPTADMTRTSGDVRF